MDEMAKAAIKTLDDGNLQFVPARFDKTYLHWLENIRDWCISRQLWWGHESRLITVMNAVRWWLEERCRRNARNADAHICIRMRTLWIPGSVPHCGRSPHLDGRTRHREFEYFYPTDVLVTGYDIIFFWVIRMVFSALEQTGETPFHHVLIHGLVRDSQGRKMSKSLGNGIDPLEVIDKYGADALRLTLMTGNAPGNDMRFYWERVEASRNFANKIWNASRFIMMNLESEGQ